LAPFSLLKGIDAVHVVANSQEAVWLRSLTPIDPLDAESGLAVLRFMEAKANVRAFGILAIASTKGTGYSVKFKPVFVRSKRAAIGKSRRNDGVFQVGARLDGSSCVGFTTFRNTAEIIVPAVRFGISTEYDIWAFHFKSAQRFYDYHVDKTSLSATHGSDQVLATINTAKGGDLRTNISVNGSGYVRSTLTLGRSFGNSFFRENIGEVKEGMASVNWTPITRSFDELLICGSNMSFKEFRTFLPRLGAVAAGEDPKEIEDNFVVGDGLGISYSLNLTGYRRLLSDDDTAKFTLSQEDEKVLS
jgi:hypothetical protein